MKHTIPGEKDPQVLSEIREFLNALNNSGGKPMETMTPQEARQVLIDAQKSVEVDTSGIAETEREITQDGISVNIHIIKPEHSKDQVLPVFMFIHGGGWVLGDYPTHKRLVRDLVVNSGAAAVFVDYTPSPDAHYPVAINQIYAATKWVAENGSEIGVDGKNMAIAGNSVGGNMTAVTCLMAKDKGGPKIKFQLLLWPVADSDFSRESYEKYAEGRFLTTNMMKWMWDNYAPDTEKRNEYYASPLKASLEKLKGLPPALVQLAENDILHDEGLAYARKLDEAGVPTTIQTFNGFIHDYGLLNPLDHIEAVKFSSEQAALGLRKALFS
ncbi:alpha/beta hydrolase [Elizabethkingia miricola]|uniref:alpha/beta hydrolase n=1 Tax=Elizabethkingia miricola TaxID=172045 RepID=UPI000B360BCA|nr:alpha/beta hydrolase [Elizabethkingia miricola]NHQ67151.1 alpha/beta hydrolase [Elizabethkingia miricola]NHQ71852.1 alpha/beta hydrolase [Elizabethkingia miricola]NHQ77792.1 alpha/beta hydrolase [Elizabethkingia miricola]PSL88902.1 alpha/beta hydrolase [Elizabethkingia miricola]QHQ88792.1 alpha/beta hydrolase [Elizabethkingia miricola]